MKKRTKVKATTPSLPEEIIEEILPRLPAKSLLKFKSVSVSWCSFISSKYFIKVQLEHARNNTPLADHSTILTTYKYNHVVRHCLVGYLFSQQQQIHDVPHCHFGYQITNWNTCLVGCCNGLCCIHIDGKYLILWNPTTGLSHKLPPALEEYDSVATQGFGYDESNDDYKVLVVYNRRSFPYIDRLYRYIYRLYSLKANTWKTVDDFMVYGKLKDSWKTVEYFRPYIHEYRAVIVNGKLHWATEINRSSFNIVTFDLGSETAGSFEQPPCSGHINRSYSSSLSVIQGCLCVVCKEPQYTGPTQVWIMKEYGVKESWCKLMTLPCLNRFGYDPLFGFTFSILCISVEGELLFQRHRDLFLYNPKTGHLRQLNITKCDQINGIAICIQSLVSPFPHGR